MADGWHPSAALRSVRAHPRAGGRAARADGERRHGLRHRPLRARRRRRARRRGARAARRPSAVHRAAAGIEIVSTVSHELRSPLTSVKGYTSLLLNRWDRLADDQKQMMLEQVHHDADRVTRLVTELLDISRLETGRLVLRRQMVDLRRAGRRRRREGAAWSTPTSRSTVDVRRRTSRRSTPTPTRSSRCSPTWSRTRAKYAVARGHAGRRRGRRAAEVAVAVADQGEGIPDADLPRVFTKFFRRAEGRPDRLGPRALDQPRPGRGPRRPADGHVEFRGRAATFRFTLPLDRLRGAARVS